MHKEDYSSEDTLAEILAKSEFVDYDIEELTEEEREAFD
jgi:hypothetical protein